MLLSLRKQVNLGSHRVTDCCIYIFITETADNNHSTDKPYIIKDDALKKQQKQALSSLTFFHTQVS